MNIERFGIGGSSTTNNLGGHLLDLRHSHRPIGQLILESCSIFELLLLPVIALPNIIHRRVKLPTSSPIFSGYPLSIIVEFIQRVFPLPSFPALQKSPCLLP